MLSVVSYVDFSALSCRGLCLTTSLVTRKGSCSTTTQYDNTFKFFVKRLVTICVDKFKLRWPYIYPPAQTIITSHFRSQYPRPLRLTSLLSSACPPRSAHAMLLFHLQESRPCTLTLVAVCLQAILRSVWPSRATKNSGKSQSECLQEGRSALGAADRTSAQAS